MLCSTDDSKARAIERNSPWLLNYNIFKIKKQVAVLGGYIGSLEQIILVLAPLSSMKQEG